MPKPDKTITQTEQLMQMLREEYEVCRAVSEVVIKPTLLAENVRKRLDRDTRSPPLLAWAAVLELRKMASELTRPEDETDRERARTPDLFTGLQRYYPAKREGEDVRVLREHLTLAERRHCAYVLRAEATSKNMHADALDAETDSLIRRGLLSESA